MKLTHKEKELIINEPTFRSTTRNFTEWSITVFGWGLWVMFLRPLMILFLWILGYRIFKFQMFYLEGYHNLESFIFGTISLSCIFLIMFGWNRYNYLRFRNLNRRQSRGPATPEEMGEFFQIPTETMEKLDASREVDVYFPDQRHIEIETTEVERFSAYYAPLEYKFKNLQAFSRKKPEAEKHGPEKEGDSHEPPEDKA